MSGLSLITNGWICQQKPLTISNKYITPLAFQVNKKTEINLNIDSINRLYLDVDAIRDKRINLKIDKHQITLRKVEPIKVNISTKGA